MQPMQITFLEDYWVLLLGILAAVVLVVVFFKALRRKRNQKRDEYLSKLEQYLESDASLQDAVRILEKRHPQFSLDDILGRTSGPTKDDTELHKQNVEALLRFFNSVSDSVYVTRTLPLDRVNCFSWYLTRIKDSKALTDYCEQKGFKKVIKLAKDIR